VLLNIPGHGTMLAREAIKHGIGFVTEDRKRFGLVLDQTILKNMTLAGLRQISGRFVTSIDAESAASERTMKPMSNSRLEDLMQCPTWGHVHSRKKYATLARAMALEAGELMHKVFSVVRIWQLWRLQKLEKHAMETGTVYHTRLDPPPANGWMPPESALQVVTGRQSDGAKEDTVANLFDDIQRHPESEVAQPLLHFKGTE